MLLNVVAMQMKEGSGGRVVGLDGWQETMVAVLRRAKVEGVYEYVTCWEGDARWLPFVDGYFDVVVSAVHLSELDRRVSGRSPAAAAATAERGRGLGEMVRVLKPEGMGVVWDLVCGPEYAQRLWEMQMEDVRLSDLITAYMNQSSEMKEAAEMESFDPTAEEEEARWILLDRTAEKIARKQSERWRYLAA